jgi:uncharacterized protein YukE
MAWQKITACPLSSPLSKPSSTPAGANPELICSRKFPKKTRANRVSYGMAQAIMDPEEVRRFAKELKRFNIEIQNRTSSLQARFQSLGDSWQDQEHAKFAEEFIGTMKALKKFVEISDKHTPYLMRKAQRIQEYLDQR